MSSRRILAAAYERQLADKLESEGWHVERVASSGARKNSVCDLVGIKDGVPHLIEVKSTWKKNFKPPKEQINILVDVSKKCGAVPMLAVLYKRKGWEIVRINLQD